MDQTKKVAFEKYSVLALLCVFGLTLAGSLRSLGVFGSKSTVKNALGKVHIKETLVETFQEFRKKIDTQTQAPSTAPLPTMQASGPPIYTAQELRDPMKNLLPEPPPPAAQRAPVKPEVKPPPPPLMVRGILWGGREPQAIINDGIYQVGDTVGGAKILSIDQTGVTIEHDGVPALYSTSAPLAAERPRSRPAQWR